MNDPQKWNRIAAYVFPRFGEVEFAEFVQTRTQWSQRDCETGLQEYRRFLYLGSLFGDAIHPAPPIAAIWKAHRSFQDYDRGLGDCLRQPAPRPGRRRTKKFTWKEVEFAYAMEFDDFPPRIFWKPGHKLVERGLIIGLAVASAGLAHVTLPELYSMTVIIVLLGGAFWPERGPVMHRPDPGAALLKAWFRR